MSQGFRVPRIFFFKFVFFFIILSIFYVQVFHNLRGGSISLYELRSSSFDAIELTFSGILLKGLIQVSIVRKPYYSLSIPIMVT